MAQQRDALFWGTLFLLCATAYEGVVLGVMLLLQIITIIICFTVESGEIPIAGTVEEVIEEKTAIETQKQ